MSLSSVPSIALQPADSAATARIETHLQALLDPFDGTTRARVETMVRRAIALGHERALLIEAHDAAQARYERASANGPSVYSPDCSEARREILATLESECRALEYRFYSLDGQFVGITR